MGWLVRLLVWLWLLTALVWFKCRCFSGAAVLIGLCHQLLKRCLPLVRQHKSQPEINVFMAIPLQGANCHTGVDQLLGDIEGRLGVVNMRHAILYALFIKAKEISEPNDNMVKNKVNKGILLSLPIYCQL